MWPLFDRRIHRRRGVAERCFDRIGRWRGAATPRHCRTAKSFQGAVTSTALPM
jgi:hypothetical protein